MAKVLSPFAYNLNGQKQHGEYKVVYEQTGRQIYHNGDYTIWKTSEYYETCWKNIVITQTTGAPRELVDALVSGVAPKIGASFYHYNRMREAINDGKRYAKEIGFDITNI
jgi:hypothetical protein